MKEIIFGIAFCGVIFFTLVMFMEKMMDWYVVTHIKRNVRMFFARNGIEEYTIDVSKQIDETIANTRYYNVMISHRAINGAWYTERHVYESRGLFNVELLIKGGPIIVECHQ